MYYIIMTTTYFNSYTIKTLILDFIQVFLKTWKFKKTTKWI